MKILPPDSISGELLNLIHNANEYLVLVSPYVSINKWPRLQAALTGAQRRGVKIKAFVRSDADNANSWEELEALDIKPRLVEHLHAKFYFSESGGLISSLNLLSSSNAQSLEIGCKLETADELRELQEYVKRYIVPLEQRERPDEEDVYLSKEKFTVVLENYLSNCTESRSRVQYRSGDFQIQAAGNTFYLNLDKGANKLHLSGIVSGDEAAAFEKFRQEFFDSPNLDFELSQGKPGYYSMVLGNYKSRLSTTYLDGLRLPEKKKLLDTVVEFVLRVRDFKEAVYAPKRAESLARKEAYEARQKDAAAAAKEKTATAVVLTEAMDSQESAL
jgi:hypothetical protein